MNTTRDNDSDLPGPARDESPAAAPARAAAPAAQVRRHVQRLHAATQPRAGFSSEI